jgi:hypothetical protein
LMGYAYPHVDATEFKSWHRTNTIKAARMVAIPVREAGKGSGRGRSFVWKPISEEALTERNLEGRRRRKQQRQP